MAVKSPGDLPSKMSSRAIRRVSDEDISTMSMYKSFMTGYTKRINDATYEVVFGDIEIGDTSYTRVADLDLERRIITYSRYAIADVPERARRYLVLHQLAHILSPIHDERFWQLIERFEPSYVQVEEQLRMVFLRNLREAQLRLSPSGLKIERGVENSSSMSLIHPVDEGAANQLTKNSLEVQQFSGQCSDSSSNTISCFGSLYDNGFPFDTVSGGLSKSTSNLVAT